MDYVPDAQGSVFALSDPDRQPLALYGYYPYGGVYDSYIPGADPNPKFKWNGTSRYYQTSLAYSDTYVRARHYIQNIGRWTTVDPFWPDEDDYQYVESNPLTRNDPTGTQRTRPGKTQKANDWDTPDCTTVFNLLYRKLQRCFSDQDARLLASILQCVAYAENSCHPVSSKEDEDKRGAFQFTELFSGVYKEKGCSLSDAERTLDGETGVQANYVAHLIASHQSSKDSLGETICHFWGVLPCSTHREAQNPKATTCLLGKKIDMYHMRVPTVKPGCKEKPKVKKPGNRHHPHARRAHRH